MHIYVYAYMHIILENKEYHDFPKFFDTFIAKVTISLCAFDIRAPRMLCFANVKIATVHFIMCFQHSDAQNAKGVAENPPPGREGRPSARALVTILG